VPATTASFSCSCDLSSGPLSLLLTLPANLHHGEGFLWSAPQTTQRLRRATSRHDGLFRRTPEEGLWQRAAAHSLRNRVASKEVVAEAPRTDGRTIAMEEGPLSQAHQGLRVATRLQRSAFRQLPDFVARKAAPFGIRCSPIRPDQQRRTQIGSRMKHRFVRGCWAHATSMRR
jgi:hypothetical protein